MLCKDVQGIANWDCISLLLAIPNINEIIMIEFLRIMVYKNYELCDKIQKEYYIEIAKLLKSCHNIYDEFIKMADLNFTDYLIIDNIDVINTIISIREFKNDMMKLFPEH